MGGKIFTTRAWLDEFFRSLADADTAYFEARDAAANATPPREAAYGSPRDRRRASRDDAARVAAAARRRQGAEEIDRELQGEGL